jgi:CTP:molybdopterin cytidylyltransferase MocA
VQALPGEYQAVLLAPADHPAIPDRVAAALIDTWETSAAKLAVPEYGGRGGHPVLVDLYFRDQLLHLDPERGLRGLFDAHREQIVRVPVDSPFIARDMDTWEDYRKLHLHVFGTEPPQQPLEVSRLQQAPGRKHAGQLLFPVPETVREGAEWCTNRNA